jgi:hypothetical protein
MIDGRLTPRDRRAWCAAARPHHHPTHDCHFEPIVGGGSAATVEAQMAAGVYIAVDGGEVVDYIGMVDRDARGIRERLRGHHALGPHWDRLWLIPFADDAPRWAVEHLERLLIWIADPPGNRVGVRRGRP